MKREKITVTFDGAVIAAGEPVKGRDRAIDSARSLWVGCIATHAPNWHEHEYLRGMVELLADTFGSPFEGEVDWDTVKDWYAYKIGGAVQ